MRMHDDDVKRSQDERHEDRREEQVTPGRDSDRGCSVHAAVTMLSTLLAWWVNRTSQRAIFRRPSFGEQTPRQCSPEKEKSPLVKTRGLFR